MGEIFSFLQTAIPTGATIRTVATLSTNADMNPENRDMKMMTHITFFALSSSQSAIRFGILDCIKKSTRTMVPPIISRTFQLIADRIDPSGRIPLTMKISAVASTIQIRRFIKTVIRMYMVRNSMIASIFNVCSSGCSCQCLQPCFLASMSVSCVISSSSMIPSAGSYPYMTWNLSMQLAVWRPAMPSGVPHRKPMLFSSS